MKSSSSDEKKKTFCTPHDDDDDDNFLDLENIKFARSFIDTVINCGSVECIPPWNGTHGMCLFWWPEHFLVEMQDLFNGEGMEGL